MSYADSNKECNNYKDDNNDDNNLTVMEMVFKIMMTIKIIAIKDDDCDASDNDSNNQGIEGNDDAAADDDDVSNHRRIDCLLSRVFRRRSKPCVTGLCEGQ